MAADGYARSSCHPGSSCVTSRSRSGHSTRWRRSSFDVAEGETVTLLGPSGCGKTTLLRLIAGLETPTSGEIVVNGMTPSEARRHKQIGFIPQAPALLPWRTVEANARLLLDINRSASPSTPSVSVADLLDEVGLGEFLDAYPHELSGGMQQRVGLVRAFALDAPILLMDEPFAALDEMTRTDMRHLLGRLREPLGTTVVFVTHSIPEATFLSDRVAVMSPRPGPGHRRSHDRSRPSPHPGHRGHRRVLPPHDVACGARSSARDGPMSPGVRRIVAPLVGIVVVRRASGKLLVQIFDIRRFVLLPPSTIIDTLAADPGFYWDNALVTDRPHARRAGDLAVVRRRRRVGHGGISVHRGGGTAGARSSYS